MARLLYLLALLSTLLLFSLPSLPPVAANDEVAADSDTSTTSTD